MRRFSPQRRRGRRGVAEKGGGTFLLPSLRRLCASAVNSLTNLSTMFISDQKCSNRPQTVAAVETATVVTMKLAIRFLFMRLTTPKFRLRSVARQNTTTALYYPPFLGM